MATSYKQLYQEAMQENERLTAENARLAAEVERTSDVIDLAGIARRMHVMRLTPGQWQQRGHLPPPDFPLITSTPIWYASTVRDQFAVPTRRLWHPEPATELSPAA